MKTRHSLVFTLLLTALTTATLLQAGGPEPKWLGHDRTRPQPTVVDPGLPSTPDKPGKAPSDAVSSTSAWDGSDIAETP